jgi:purine-binding chemotaxis protein CheW
MTILSPLKTRRSKARRAAATQQMIVFRLRQEWFALPIVAVSKVVQSSQVYGDPQKSGVSVAIYQGKELLVIDVGHRIFGEVQRSQGTNPPSLSKAGFWVVVQNARAELAGLPIDSPPSVQRFAQTAIAPLPETYLSEANIRCVSSLTIQSENAPPVFLLDPERLFQTQQIVPPSSRAITKGDAACNFDRSC